MSDLTALWRRWREGRDPPAREALIVRYLPLVRYIAGRLAFGVPAAVDQGDLESYGLFGLIDAVERFEPSRGFRFETFAAPRIRGAILDGLRSESWAPVLRKKAHQLQAAYNSLETTLSRSPTDAELAGALGISSKELQRWQAQLGAVTVLSLDEPVPLLGDGGEITLAEMLPDASATDPGREAARLERARGVTEALPVRTEKERLVVTLFYYEGLTAREIGEVLGLTPARISQLHSMAILRLRGRLARRKAQLTS